YVEKKVKKVRLNIDREIDLYISNAAYNDQDKFDIVPNGDGSVNMIIKNVMSYIEK
ncbi:nucleoid-associated protein, partial [Clostridium botulinum]|nr:nucleoid-associated protein [Clostridium botulinum]